MQKKRNLCGCVTWLRVKPISKVNHLASNGIQKKMVWDISLYDEQKKDQEYSF